MSAGKSFRNLSVQWLHSYFRSCVNTLQVAPDNHTLWEARCVPGPSSRMRTQSYANGFRQHPFSVGKSRETKNVKKYQKIIPNQFLEGFFIVLRVSMCLLQSSSNAPLTAGNMGGTWREISAAEVGTLLEFSNCLWLQNCSPEAAFCWFCFCQMSSKSR